MDNSNPNNTDEKLVNVALIVGILLVMGGLSAFVSSNKINAWLFLLLPITTIGTIIAVISKVKNSKNSKLKFAWIVGLVILAVVLVLCTVWWFAASGA